MNPVGNEQWVLLDSDLSVSAARHASETSGVLALFPSTNVLGAPSD